MIPRRLSTRSAGIGWAGGGPDGAGEAGAEGSMTLFARRVPYPPPRGRTGRTGGDREEREVDDGLFCACCAGEADSGTGMSPVEAAGFDGDMKSELAFGRGAGGVDGWIPS